LVENGKVNVTKLELAWTDLDSTVRVRFLKEKKWDWVVERLAIAGVNAAMQSKDT
jgi:hypothetical protein